MLLIGLPPTRIMEEVDGLIIGGKVAVIVKKVMIDIKDIPSITVVTIKIGGKMHFFEINRFRNKNPKYSYCKIYNNRILILHTFYIIIYFINHL